MKERERVRFRFIERAGMIIWSGRVVLHVVQYGVL